MRKKELIWNTYSALIFQFVSIIAGFIIPRLILTTFGSEVNGLISSIAQFLQIIAFLELGVGSVVTSSLYKPLVQKNSKSINLIIKSANSFFRKIGNVMVIYIIILVFVYPLIVNQTFDFIYTSSLILIISISSFARYYFGIVDSLFLSADQRSYISNTIQIFTIILNTVICVILINLGQSIQVIKLAASSIFLLRPIIQRIYVNKHYTINRKVVLTSEPIEQKWNGIAQHLAAIILDGTDVIVLSVFSTLANVSIYSVYYLVTSGIKKIVFSLASGIRGIMGEQWAKQEIKKLNDLFGWTEWLIHTGSILIFGCTGILILPFVQIYTKGIVDVNYYHPLFAFLITLAAASRCLRLPYHTMILATGHYKQTQINYIVAAIINIIISVITVNIYGLVGVAIGTICALFYQIIWMAIYNYKKLLNRPMKNFIKQLGVDALTVLICFFITKQFIQDSDTFVIWMILAIKVFCIWLVIIIIINSLFYTKKMKVIRIYFNSKIKSLFHIK